MRTCVACREPGARAELARLVEGPDGAIAVDPRARAGGRGAWVHPTRACITLAAKRHAAERTLKVSVRTVDADALVSQVRQALERKAASLLGVAQRTRKLAIGAAAAAESLDQGTASLVLVAKDAGANSRAVLDEHPAAQRARVRMIDTKERLGAAVGRTEVAILVLTDAKIADELAATMDRLAGVEG